MEKENLAELSLESLKCLLRTNVLQFTAESFAQLLLTNYSESFEDNEFLYKYTDLLLKTFSPEDSSQIRVGFEIHHAIPVAYYSIKLGLQRKKARYRLEKAALTDENNFLVRFSYIDHCLAHFYLCKCTKGRLNYYCLNALGRMSKTKIALKINSMSADSFLDLCAPWQKALADFRQAQSILRKKVIQEQQQADPEYYTGRTWYTNGTDYTWSKVCPPGWWKRSPTKGQKRTAAQKAELSEIAKKRGKDPDYCENVSKGFRKYYADHPGSAQGKVWVHNGTEEIYILAEEALPEGFVFGRLPLKIWITNGTKIQKIKRKSTIPEGWVKIENNK